MLLLLFHCFFFFFFKQKMAYDMRISDWSSDVCSSDLRDEALRRIKAISDALQLSVDQIPGFLEDYGDIFLSLSYFKRYLDKIRPDFAAMKTWMHAGIADSHLRHNKHAVRACETVNVNVEAAIRFVLGRFQAIAERRRELWVAIGQAA